MQRSCQSDYRIFVEVYYLYVIPLVILYSIDTYHEFLKRPAAFLSIKYKIVLSLGELSLINLKLQESGWKIQKYYL